LGGELIDDDDEIPDESELSLLLEVEGVCGACVNNEAKKKMVADGVFAERQKWLTQYIKDNRTNEEIMAAAFRNAERLLGGRE
jgi:hypothetical protein